MGGALPPAGAPHAPPPACAPPAPPVPQQQQPAAMPQQAPLSPVPNTGFVAPTSADPFGLCFSPLASPVTSPGGSPRGSPGALVPSAAAPGADPYGVFGQRQPAADPFGSYASPAQSGAPAVVDDPFGEFLFSHSSMAMDGMSRNVSKIDERNN